MTDIIAQFTLETPGLLPVFLLLAVQIGLGGLDNLLHHEMTEALPARPEARRELGLHSARELIYSGVFVVFACLRPDGVFALIFAAILLGEILITLADFIEEDRTRVLPPFERVLHTILALNYGAVLALLAPVLWAWAQAPAAVVVETRGAWTPLLLIAALGVGLWGVRDLIAAQRPAHQTPVEPSGRTVLVTGATGFLGHDLVAALKARGDHVIALSRRPRTAARKLGVEAVADMNAVRTETAISTIINLAGANIAARPWSPARRRALLDSRLTTTRAVNALIARLETPPAVLINASAVGVYGDGGETPLDEDAPSPRGTFTADLCRAWEAEAEKARQHTVRTVLLRFGLIFGRDGGAFPRLTLSRPFGMLARFGTGRQWMAWIHKHDAIGLILHAIDTPALDGPVNAVAPAAARHGQVIGALANRRLVVPIPAFALKAGLGEMSRLFLDSQKVRARKALASGYAFAYPTLNEAVADLTAHRKPLEIQSWERPRRRGV
jgi:hypothetical protein